MKILIKKLKFNVNGITKEKAIKLGKINKKKYENSCTFKKNKCKIKKTFVKIYLN